MYEDVLLYVCRQWPVQDDTAPSGSIQSVIEQLQAMLHDLQNKMVNIRHLEISLGVLFTLYM